MISLRKSAAYVVTFVVVVGSQWVPGVPEELRLLQDARAIINPIGVKNRKGSLGSPYSVQDYLAVNPSLATWRTCAISSGLRMTWACISS